MSQTIQNLLEDVDTHIPPTETRKNEGTPNVQCIAVGTCDQEPNGRPGNAVSLNGDR